MLSHIQFQEIAEKLPSLAPHAKNFRIPIAVEFNSDLDTPLSLYLKIANEEKYSFLLESVVAGSQFSRYSYLGFCQKNATRVCAYGFGEEAYLEIFNQNNQNIQSNKNIQNDQEIQEIIEKQFGNPLTQMQALLKTYHAAHIEGLPRFGGGWLGYFSYETIHHIEKIPAPIKKNINLNLPDIQFMLCDYLLVIDNLTAKSQLIVYANPNEHQAYEKAQQAIADILLKIQQPLQQSLQQSLKQVEENINLNINLNNKNNDNIKYDFPEEEFLKAVDVAKTHIQNGNAMQIVLSQRMQTEFNEKPIELYRALRRLNPSPYMYFYRFDDLYMVGASPELLLRLENTENTENTEGLENPQQRRVTLRPIAGTRPRGATPKEDQKLADELINDPKECAEHTMLIDLARNDIGRIAVAGSVEVTEKMVIERYSHVQHIVSSVQGRVLKNMDAIDVLKAVFPAGTLSGAPKVRAMQIIRELEPHQRHLYGGAVGYIAFDGQMDLAIAIRSAMIYQQKAYIQAGAGIVYDSIKQHEWQETKQKANAVLKAIQNAKNYKI